MSNVPRDALVRRLEELSGRLERESKRMGQSATAAVLARTVDDLDAMVTWLLLPPWEKPPWEADEEENYELPAG